MLDDDPFFSVGLLWIRAFSFFCGYFSFSFICVRKILFCSFVWINFRPFFYFSRVYFILFHFLCFLYFFFYLFILTIKKIVVIVKLMIDEYEVSSLITFIFRWDLLWMPMYSRWRKLSLKITKKLRLLELSRLRTFFNKFKMIMFVLLAVNIIRNIIKSTWR